MVSLVVLEINVFTYRHYHIRWWQERKKCLSMLDISTTIIVCKLISEKIDRPRCRLYNDSAGSHDTVYIKSGTRRAKPSDEGVAEARC